MWHMVMVYVGFVCGVLSALVSLNLILRADYEGLGLCALDIAPEEVAGGINIAGYLCMEVHNLNDHGALDMPQGNRKDKGRETCYRLSTKVSLKNCSRVWVSHVRCISKTRK